LFYVAFSLANAYFDLSLKQIEETERAFETLRQGRGQNGELVVKVMVGIESGHGFVNENGTSGSVAFA